MVFFEMSYNNVKRGAWIFHFFCLGVSETPPGNRLTKISFWKVLYHKILNAAIPAKTTLVQQCRQGDIGLKTCLSLTVCVRVNLMCFYDCKNTQVLCRGFSPQNYGLDCIEHTVTGMDIRNNFTETKTKTIQ